MTDTKLACLAGGKTHANPSVASRCRDCCDINQYRRGVSDEHQRWASGAAVRSYMIRAKTVAWTTFAITAFVMFISFGIAGMIFACPLALLPALALKRV